MKGRERNKIYSIMPNYELSDDVLAGLLAGTEKKKSVKADKGDKPVKAVEEEVLDLSYDRCIAVSRQDLANFLKVVDPLTKATIDDYGRCVYFECVGGDVEIRYVNRPYTLAGRFTNRSGKEVGPFAVAVETLKQLLTGGFSTVIFVETEDGISFVFGGQLIFVRTVALDAAVYSFPRKEASNKLDVELAQYAFSKVGTVLSLSERASEKIIVVKDGRLWFNTGSFAAKIDSPFEGDVEMLLFSQVVSVISNFAGFCDTLTYSVDGGSIIISCGDLYYAELPIGIAERVKDFYSKGTEVALGFVADVAVVDDNLSKFLALVNSLSYWADNVDVECSASDLQFTLHTDNKANTTVYKFPVSSGIPEFKGSFSVSIKLLRTFLAIVDSGMYSFTENGIGVVNGFGSFLVRVSK